MNKISKDSPFYYLTFVTNRRLPVFRTEELSLLCSEAFSEAANSGGFQIYAYVIMPDHIHIITGDERKPSDTLRFLKGISAKRIIDHLKTRNLQVSLEKLRRKGARGVDSFALWQRHSNTFLITNETMLMRKVNYIHLNPVKERLVDLPGDYRFSSARIWQRRRRDDEPLDVNVGLIRWSRG